MSLLIRHGQPQAHKVAQYSNGVAVLKRPGIGTGPGPGPSPDPVLLQTNFTAGSFATGGFTGYANPVTTRTFGTMVDDKFGDGISVAAIQTQTGGSLTEFALFPATVPWRYFLRFEVVGITDPGWNGGPLVYYAQDSELIQYVNFSGATYWTYPLVTPFVDGDEYQLRVYGTTNDVFTVTAGAAASLVGYNTYGTAPIGALDPTDQLDLYTVTRASFQSTTSDFRYSLNIPSIAPDYTGIVRVSGITDPLWNGGVTFIGQAQNLSYVANDAGNSAWRYSGAPALVTGDEYRMEVTAGAFYRGDMTTGTTLRGFQEVTGQGSLTPQQIEGESYRITQIWDTATSALRLYFSEPNIPNTDASWSVIRVVNKASPSVVHLEAFRLGSSYTANDNGETRWQINGLSPSLTLNTEYIVELYK